MPRLVMNTLPSLELFVNTKHVIPSQHLIDAETCGWGSKSVSYEGKSEQRVAAQRPHNLTSHYN